MSKPSGTFDISLFQGTKHPPSLAALRRGAGAGALAIRDFCVPVNAYFPSPSMFEHLRQNLEDVLKYYPTAGDTIGATLARALEIPDDALVLGNGSTELITWIDRLFVEESVVVPVPTFGRLTDQPEETGKRVVHYLRRPEVDFRLDPDEFVPFVLASDARVAVFCNPNNPTGAALEAPEVVRILDGLAGLDLIVVDESFIDFADETTIPSVMGEAMTRSNVIVLKSLGKNYGLHGVRAGFAVTNPQLAGRLRAALPRWNVNSVAEWLIDQLTVHLGDYEDSRRRSIRDRIAFESALRGVAGLRVYPSRANFVYAHVTDRVNGKRLRDELLTKHGILVRECSNKVGSTEQHFRFASRPFDDVQLLLSRLSEAMRALRT